MEKSSQSSVTGDSYSSGSSSTATRDQYLKHLNKLSHKISKPTFLKNPTFDHNQIPPESSQAPAPAPALAQPQHHQPPVYNINKSDFRDVVQKLTGSPAHERFSNPQPIHAPKPQSSRLQRIRPPPLANVCNRPPPLLNSAMPEPSLNPRNSISSNFGPIVRPHAPLSPLPPLPSVHAPAESPVSAYMRYLHNSFSSIDSNQKQFSGFSPLAPLVPQPTIPQGTVPHQYSSETQFSIPASPLPFGCMNSPKSAYPLLSPGLLFSPSSGSLGYPQFPLSPTVPVPSPRWRGL